MDKKHSKILKVGILGSLFDPPHRGHLFLARTALKTAVIDEVWLMPNYSHPWREAKESAQDRLAMCRLLVKNEQQIKVSEMEITRQGKSYTIDTVRQLKKQYPNYHFYWIMGNDRLIDLNKWKNIKQLLKEIEFIVLPKIKISSTMIRGRLKNQLSIIDLVPKEIEGYIKKHRLYL